MASSITAFDTNVHESGANNLNLKLLKPLDEALRCHICFDYFTNCMITKCSHNYCSVCIRRYMTYKSQCPTCFQEATEPELRNNRLMDEVLRIYKKIRETIQAPVEANVKSEPPSSSRSVEKDNFEKSSTSQTPVQTTSKQQPIEGDIAPDEASCPVCYTTVPMSRINIHLDSCLNKTEERRERKSLPKLVYHLLKDNDIRKKLKEHGLSSSGNRQALIRRLKNFTILYNANSDSLNPKPVSELIIELERQELEERLTTPQKSIQVNKKSDPYLIEKEHENYVQEHKSQFNALIEDVQQRAIEPIKIKEECSESLLDGLQSGDNLDKVQPEKASKLPFRIKKELPDLKMKGSSIDMTNEEVSSDSPSHENLEDRKMSANTYQKRKYARRLSAEEKCTQRKK